MKKRMWKKILIIEIGCEKLLNHIICFQEKLVEINLKVSEYIDENNKKHIRTLKNGAVIFLRSRIFSIA